MREITREVLKTKLDHKEDFKLVMVMPKETYEAMHIPGSIYVESIEDGIGKLHKEDEIVVYCTGRPCRNSEVAYRFLEARGYPKIYYYAGGLPDWQAAGYPLEGRLAKTTTPK